MERGIGYGGPFHSHKAKAVLVADPDASPDLIRFAQTLLMDGGTGVRMQELDGRYIRDIADLVVVLCTQREPSSEVVTAVNLAREHGKPLHALVEAGSGCKIDA